MKTGFIGRARIAGLNAAHIQDLVGKALEEDIGAGDVTTDSIVPAHARIKAAIFARAEVVVSGNMVAGAVFKALDSSIEYTARVEDGEVAPAAEPIAVIRGQARPILAGERTALNFMQRMSGIATLTSRFVRKAAPYGVEILDTRKTTPLLRELEKYAVRCGGGINHRMGLYDRVLIKDNHRKLLRGGRLDNIAWAVAKARRSCPGMTVEVEVETESELRSALEARPDWILLDNVPPEKLKRYVKLCAGKCLVEASGGINIGNIERIARAGVNAVSLGCLTHSAPASDLSLEVI